MSGRKTVALRVHFKSVSSQCLCAFPHAHSDYIRHAGIILRIRCFISRYIKHCAEAFLYIRPCGRKLSGHSRAFAVRYGVYAQLAKNRFRIAHVHPRHIGHGHMLGFRAAVRLGNAEQRQDFAENLRGKRCGGRSAVIRLDLRFVDRNQQRDLRILRRRKAHKRTDMQIRFNSSVFVYLCRAGLSAN